MKNLLVAIDFEDTSRYALRIASRLLKNSAKWDRQIDPVVLRCSQH